MLPADPALLRLAAAERAFFVFQHVLVAVIVPLGRKVVIFERVKPRGGHLRPGTRGWALDRLRARPDCSRARVPVTRAPRTRLLSRVLVYSAYCGRDLRSG